MGGDLERFLRQAAERLAEKVQEGKAPRPAQPRRPEGPARRAEQQRSTLPSELIEAEVVQAPRYPAPVRRGDEQGRRAPKPVSSIESRGEPLTSIENRQASLGQHVDQADDRMAARQSQIFGGSVSMLKPATPLAPAPTGGHSHQPTNLQARERSVSPLLEMLRKPQTLRAAFLASEIFQRKW